MTRKHFEAIARILVRERVGYLRTGDPRSAAVVDVIAQRLADYFATVNPNFSRCRFLGASRDTRGEH